MPSGVEIRTPRTVAGSSVVPASTQRGADGADRTLERVAGRVDLDRESTGHRWSAEVERLRGSPPSRRSHASTAREVGARAGRGELRRPHAGVGGEPDLQRLGVGAERRAARRPRPAPPARWPARSAASRPSATAAVTAAPGHRWSWWRATPRSSAASRARCPAGPLPRRRPGRPRHRRRWPAPTGTHTVLMWVVDGMCRSSKSITWQAAAHRPASVELAPTRRMWCSRATTPTATVSRQGPVGQRQVVLARHQGQGPVSEGLRGRPPVPASPAAEARRRSARS